MILPLDDAVVSGAASPCAVLDVSADLLCDLFCRSSAALMKMLSYVWKKEFGIKYLWKIMSPVLIIQKSQM